MRTRRVSGEGGLRSLLAAVCELTGPLVIHILLPFNTCEHHMTRVRWAVRWADVSNHTTASTSRGFHLRSVMLTHLSPFCVAVSFIPSTSEPAPGSLIASAPTCSPDISLGK